MRIFLVPTIILFLATTAAFGETASIVIPAGHVLGISPPCASLHEARNKALRDAASQVLRTIGAHYSLQFQSTIEGTADNAKTTVNERFHYSAHAFIRDLEQNTVKATYEDTPAGYVYRVLIYYPSEKIERMRRLSLGPQLSANTILRTQNKLVIEITESGGVQATIDAARITTTKDLRFGDFINYYVTKTQKHISTNTQIRIPAVTLKNSTKTVTLDLDRQASNPFYAKNTSIELIGKSETGQSIIYPVD